MEDSKIVALYWERNEHAIDATAAKYGHYSCSISLCIRKRRPKIAKGIGQ